MKWWHPKDTDHRSQAEFGKVIFDEVIKKDCYGLRDFFKTESAGQVKTIIDIGANIGAFSLLAACLFPGARRIAVEPSLQNLELLKENLAGTGAECHQFALGDGKCVSMVRDSRWSGSDHCVSNPSGTIASRRFSDLMRELNVPKAGLLVKVDCEGGEFHLVDDDKAGEWLSQCLWFGAEFHENHLEGKNARFRWETWFYGTFGEAFHKTKKEIGVDMGKIILFDFKAIRKAK